MLKESKHFFCLCLTWLAIFLFNIFQSAVLCLQTHCDMDKKLQVFILTFHQQKCFCFCLLPVTIGYWAEYLAGIVDGSISYDKPRSDSVSADVIPINSDSSWDVSHDNFLIGLLVKPQPLNSIIHDRIGVEGALKHCIFSRFNQNRLGDVSDSKIEKLQ